MKKFSLNCDAPIVPIPLIVTMGLSCDPALAVPPAGFSFGSTRMFNTVHICCDLSVPYRCLLAVSEEEAKSVRNTLEHGLSKDLLMRADCSVLNYSKIMLAGISEFSLSTEHETSVFGSTLFVITNPGEKKGQIALCVS